MPSKILKSLTGMYLNWSEDDDSYSTYRFEGDLGDGTVLLEFIGLQTGEPLGHYRIAHHDQIAADHHIIYKDWESRESWSEEDKEKVVKLVRKEEQNT